MPTIHIDRLRVTPDRVVPGQPVLVEALDADGGVLDGPDVVINGIPGGRQFLQFGSAGSYQVHAASGRSGDVVVRSETLSVGRAQTAAPSLPQRFPLLVARQPTDVRSPYAVQFSAQDTEAWTVDAAAAYNDASVDAEGLQAASTVATWSWDFGTGDTIVASSPEVQYDFAPHLAVDEEHKLFDVTCDVTMRDGSVSRVARTMSVVNAYALCRKRGVLALPVTSTSAARKVLKAFQASVVVRNPESVSLIVTRRQFVWGDASSEHTTPLEHLPAPIELAPGAASTLSVSVGFDVIPATVRSFSVLWLGTDAEGRTVHVEAALDVPLPDHRTKGVRYGELTFTRLLSRGLEQVLGAVAVEQVADVHLHGQVAERVVVADTAQINLVRALQQKVELDRRSQVLQHGKAFGVHGAGLPSKLAVELPIQLKPTVGGGLIGAAGQHLALGEIVEQVGGGGVVQPVGHGGIAAAAQRLEALTPLAALGLDVVAEQVGPLGVNAEIAGSIGALLADDVASAAFVGALDDKAPHSEGGLVLSKELVDLSDWAQ